MLILSTIVFATSFGLSPETRGDERMKYGTEPLVLGREARRLGEWVPDLEFKAADGSRQQLSTVAGEKGLVIAVRDPDCPLSMRYGPRVRRLRAELEQAGFGLLFVGTEDAKTARRDLEEFELSGPYAVDHEGILVRELEAQSTTEVFVLDAARTLVYRGMLDDQYGLGFARPAAKHTYLMDAIADVAAGKAVRVPATQAQGCLLPNRELSAETREVTYHDRISRIVQARCETCHRPGAIAPFGLTSFAQVKKKADMIEWAVDDQTMPPWHADLDSGPWRNDKSLTEREKEDFLEWIANDTPAGEADRAPLPRDWSTEWSIGQPDVVVPMPEPLTIPAEGVVQYRYVYAKTDFAEDRWVQAMEIRPGAPEVVHHVLVFIESPEVMRAIERGDRAAAREFQGGSDTYFACTVPGQAGLVFPEGFGKLLPAGAWLKFQLHYTPNGREQVDQSELGLIFADGPVHTEIRTNSAYNKRFAIPPRTKDHKVSAIYRFPEDATILSVFPHTHLRGDRFLFSLEYPDGRDEDLLPISLYDFNWQVNYELSEPVTVPAGTKLRATAWYDNTEKNPANPDPDVTVRFGEQTFEEMMIGYVNWVPGDADANASDAEESAGSPSGG